MTSTTEPTLLVIGLLRYVAWACGCYLVAVTALGVLGRLTQLRRVLRAVDRLTLPGVRRFLDASFGVSLAAAAVASPAAAATPPEHPPPTMVRLPDGGHRSRAPAPPEDQPTTTTTTPRTTTTTSTTVADAPVSTTVADAPPSTTTTAPPPVAVTTPSTATSTTIAVPAPSPSSPAPPAPTPAPSPAPVDPPPRPGGTDWTVERGDHFWSIAHRVLASAWARAPSDAETDRYWRRLVEANRDHLAVRDNPDLLFAGQVLVLPEPMPAKPIPAEPVPP